MPIVNTSTIPVFNQWANSDPRLQKVPSRRVLQAGYCGLRKRGVSVLEAWNTSKSAHGPRRLSQSPALNVALPAMLFCQMGSLELMSVNAT